MTALSNLPALRDAVVASLRAKIPSVSIEPHGGSFDEKEIQAFATKAPAIRIALLGFDQVSRHASGQVWLPVNFAAAIVTKDQLDDGAKVTRDTAALLISNAVALAVAGNRFGLSGVKQPENLRGGNLYSGDVLKMGVALWQVTWTSPVLLGESVDEALAAMTQLIVNGIVFADPQPTGATPPLTPPGDAP
ncbi:MAG TPA: hypothetical protein VIF61_00375 [Methylocystis sp.]|jgi:hypothetical protein